MPGWTAFTSIRAVLWSRRSAPIVRSAVCSGALLFSRVAPFLTLQKQTAMTQLSPEPMKTAIQPTAGEVITSLATGNSYTIGERIGEGNFGIVYSCKDVWNNDLATKVLKPIGSYEAVKAAAEAEFRKLLHLRNPNITFVYDAFEYRDTFYIITERCHSPITNLFTMQNFDGKLWLMPLARGLLQAVHYLHINNYAHQDIHPGNVFAAFVKDEMTNANQVIQFKLGDLGVARLLHEVNVQNTRAQWMLPPEVLNGAEFGPTDHRIDIYHIGLLFLQIAYSKELRFTTEEILAGKPREMALALPMPYSVALEKALRRHVLYRTANAMEFWRDLHTPQLLPSQQLQPSGI
ncbi:protein kinase family protein [Paraburkholderia sp. A2RI-6]|uniref:protein kinase family protein n=1 Tax=Paraburkholderia sp. A2RI-6 TaxID=3028371 RepID=UPI003B785BDA